MFVCVCFLQYYDDETLFFRVCFLLSKDLEVLHFQLVIKDIYHVKWGLCMLYPKKTCSYVSLLLHLFQFSWGILD